jgi:hypothetical protein
MLLLSDGSFNYGDIIVWLYIDEYKIDSDIMHSEARYRRVGHNTWPLSPNPAYAAAALDKVIEEIKRKQT